MRLAFAVAVFVLSSSSVLAQQETVIRTAPNNTTGQCQYFTIFSSTSLPAGCAAQVPSESAFENAIKTAQNNLDSSNASLRELIELLQKHINDLAQANDALTKRVNDMEAKIKSDDKTSLKEPQPHNSRLGKQVVSRPKSPPVVRAIEQRFI